MIRPPEPHPSPWRNRARLPRRKQVTICAAGINQLKIIAVKDMKLSFFGGTISSEGVAWKQRMINSQWQVMFSGDVSTLTPMLDAIVEAVKKAKQKGLRHFARLCAHAYRAEREKIIEDEVLPDYDLSTYADYLALKTTDPSLFDAIGTKITDAEEGWHLLFCGFDDKHVPHLFVLSGRGKIQYCDTPGFAAIGSGGWAASVALASYPYRTGMDRGEAAYCLLAAKFAAESAEGVGKETILQVLEPGEPLSSFIFDKTISDVRDKWHTLPRIPDNAADEIEAALKKNDGILRNARTRRITKKTKNILADRATPALSAPSQTQS
jgi:hypothetical protein